MLSRDNREMLFVTVSSRFKTADTFPSRVLLISVDAALKLKREAIQGQTSSCKTWMALQGRVGALLLITCCWKKNVIPPI